MYKFKKLNSVDGFDYRDLDNARQNNYAWSMSELDDYIYVGTGRNVPLTIQQSIAQNIISPDDITPIKRDDSAEIWRYKKDRSESWERVYKSPSNLGITGFRYMITTKSANLRPCIYASTFGTNVKVLKSYDGINWLIMPYENLKGNSSRYMVTIKDKLYLAVVDEFNEDNPPLLYRSRDPEFYPWELVTDYKNPSFNPKQNPEGEINNMAIFNNKLYVSTSHPDGAQVWRSNRQVPEMNDWTLIADKGFGDSENKHSLSIGTYEDYLYVSGIKRLPLSWALPLGFDMIRVDKNDNWELVVGGQPISPVTPTKGTRGESISGYKSGFNNPFNVYAWQMKEYNGNLLVSTFDSSSNMKLILKFILLNKELVEEKIGKVATELIITIYKTILRLLYKFDYPIGFDLYKSTDGKSFRPIFKDGLGYPNNYGGRILYVDSKNHLYIGTANPFTGCQVWKKINNTLCCPCSECCNLSSVYSQSYDLIRDEIIENFKILADNLPSIIELLPTINYYTPISN